MPFVVPQGDQRLFEGWATVEVRDKQGELIPLDVIMPHMDAFLKRGGPLMLNHSNWQVGRIYAYEKRRKEDANADGLWVRGTCFSDYPVDDDVWNAIQEGELAEMSIAGQFEVNEDGVAEWGAPMEVSLTGSAVGSQAINEEATIEKVARAKSRAYAQAMKLKVVT